MIRHSNQLTSSVRSRKIVDESKSLVLLGIGHTNAHVIQQWQKDPIRGCDLTCISQFPTATYSGMLPGTLGLQFDDDEMRIDLSDFCQRSGAKLILANTCGLDLQAGKIQFKDHESIRFDALSIGVGSVTKGWESHMDASSMVPIKPMQTFLQRLTSRLDRCRRGGDDFPESELVASAPIKVAVVGGGVASVEIALCLDQYCQKLNIRRDLSITIMTSGQQVAEGMSPPSIERLERILASRRIAMAMGQRVTEVGDDFIVTQDGTRQAVDVVIWATGAAPPKVLGRLGLQTDDQGFIATAATLQSLTDPRVFAVGDSGTVVQSPSPKAGVYAVRQAPVLWHNLKSTFNGGRMKNFMPQSDFLKLLNTGDGKALLQYGRLTAHAKWCYNLKKWIDKRFITQFQNG